MSLVGLSVFHVKDERGNKLKDQNIINYIQQVTLISILLLLIYIYGPTYNSGLG